MDLSICIPAFVSGYLNARGQSDVASVDRVELFDLRPVGLLVRYGPGMGREREWWLASGDAGGGTRSAHAFQAGDWLTLFRPLNGSNTTDIPSGLQLRPVASEIFMTCSIADSLHGVQAAADGPRRGTPTVRLLATQADRDWIDGLDLFHPTAKGSEPGAGSDTPPPVFHFLASVGEEPAAIARYGLCEGGSAIVVDRVLTRPELRRRGAARAVMVGLLEHARANGAQRALLISSQDGYALYESLGFRPECQVEVFAAE